LSAKQVVEEAKKNGITITEAHVYKIRSTAKGKAGSAKASKGAAPRAKPGPKPSASSGQSKRDFVLSFGPDTKASEILKKAKDAGIGLSKAYLYTIRSAGGASQKRGRPAGSVRAKAVSAGRAVTNFAGHEAQFVEASIQLGLAKAGELLDRLRARLKGL
jgi:type III secretion system FlhB-like substrate exporter